MHGKLNKNIQYRVQSLIPVNKGKVYTLCDTGWFVHHMSQIRKKQETRKLLISTSESLLIDLKEVRMGAVLGGGKFTVLDSFTGEG